MSLSHHSSSVPMTSSMMTVSTMHTLSVLSNHESEMISASSIPIDASEAAQAPNQFDFDLWIEEHHLSDIKNILVERDLCDLQTLTLQSNSFSNLIGFDCVRY